MIRQYFVNWSLYLRGFRWLWTREWGRNGLYPAGSFSPNLDIKYQPGWTPLKFCLLVYWWDYGLGTLFGCGVVSLSQFWYERSKLMRTLAGMEHPGEDEDCRALGCRPANPFSRFMTRLLNLALPGKVHGALTGPRLWGSRSLWGVEGVR